MGYLGTPIDTNNTFQSLQGKRFSGNGSTTAFTLDVAPTSTFDIEVFVENVRQDPNSAYSLSGVTLTFAAAPGSGTNNIYVIHQAKAVGTISAGEGTVQASSFSNDVISGHTALAAEPADTDEFLVSDAGTIKRIDYSLIKGKGKIGQVVQTVKTDTFTTTSTSLTALTGLTANITPTASNSKILVNVSIGAVDGSAAIVVLFQLLRGTTIIGLGDASESRSRVMFKSILAAGNRAQASSNQFLDSPSSTSQLTYSIKMACNQGTAYINRSSGDGTGADYGRTISTITLMEILA